MKVCLTSPYLYPAVIGGAEKYVYSLACSLRNMDLDVVVITSTPSSVFPKNPLEDFDVVFLKSAFRLGVNPITPTLFKAIKQEKPDIVHTQAPTITADLSLLSCKSLRIPIISTYHASITRSSVPHALLAFYDVMHNNFTLKQCNHIIATTERYKTMLQRVGLRENKISVIPVGIERDFVEAEISREVKERFESLISRLGYNPSSIILFVGALDRYHMYKGMDKLLAAFKMVVNKYPDSLLIVVGDGDQRSFYEMLCKQLRLVRNTLFVGFVSRESLIAFYSFSNLFILPSVSFSEGFGTVLLEAMSRGCPVVTTIYAGGAEIVRKEKAGGVISSIDPFSLSQKIIYFIENADFAKKCGKNGIQAVRQKYTWDSISAKVLEIYKRYAN